MHTGDGNTEQRAHAGKEHGSVSQNETCVYYTVQ